MRMISRSSCNNLNNTVRKQSHQFILSSYHQRLIWCWFGIRSSWLIKSQLLAIVYIYALTFFHGYRGAPLRQYTKVLRFLSHVSKWVLSLLHELRLSHLTSIVYLDSQSACLLTQNQSFIHEPIILNLTRITFVITYKKFNSLSIIFLPRYM